MHDNYKGGSSSLKSLEDYLFPNLENAPEEAYCGVVEEDIFKRMREHVMETLF